MPVIRGTVRKQPADVLEPLISQLTDELLAEGSPQGPIVFEVPMGHAGQFEVIVVWEKFRGLNPDEQEAIVREAYRRFDEARKPAPPLSPDLTLVLGATYEEALDLHLLPFAVVSMARQGEADQDALRQAMIQEGAIQTPQGFTDLRFPSRQMAEESVERLRQKLPSGYWGIEQSLSSAIKPG